MIPSVDFDIERKVKMLRETPAVQDLLFKSLKIGVSDEVMRTNLVEIFISELLKEKSDTKPVPKNLVEVKPTFTKTEKTIIKSKLGAKHMEVMPVSYTAKISSKWLKCLCLHSEDEPFGECKLSDIINGADLMGKTPYLAKVDDRLWFSVSSPCSWGYNVQDKYRLDAVSAKFVQKLVTLQCYKFTYLDVMTALTKMLGYIAVPDVRMAELVHKVLNDNYANSNMWLHNYINVLRTAPVDNKYGNMGVLSTVDKDTQKVLVYKFGQEIEQASEGAEFSIKDYNSVFVTFFKMFVENIYMNCRKLSEQSSEELEQFINYLASHITFYFR